MTTASPPPAAAGTYADRIWTLPQLRQAVALAYGTTRAGYPNVRPLAARLDVSTRSVQRWLHGDSLPKPERLEQLRVALLPDPLVLAQQADDRRWAANAARAMQTPRLRGVDKQWIAQNWHKPHRLLILDNAAAGIRRPSIELINRAKSSPTQRHWTREDVVELPNRPAAMLVRALLLEQVAAWRIRVHPGYTEGHTLCWLTDAPTPLLSALAHQGGWR